MSDAIDDVTEEATDAAQEEEIVSKVLDELGINLDQSVCASWTLRVLFYFRPYLTVSRSCRPHRHQLRQKSFPLRPNLKPGWRTCGRLRNLRFVVGHQSDSCVCIEFNDYSVIRSNSRVDSCSMFRCLSFYSRPTTSELFFINSSSPHSSL
jgi:hypothetical protein